MDLVTFPIWKVPSGGTFFGSGRSGTGNFGFQAYFRGNRGSGPVSVVPGRFQAKVGVPDPVPDPVPGVFRTLFRGQVLGFRAVCNEKFRVPGSLFSLSGQSWGSRPDSGFRGHFLGFQVKVWPKLGYPPVVARFRGPDPESWGVPPDSGI